MVALRRGVGLKGALVEGVKVSVADLPTFDEGVGISPGQGWAVAVECSGKR